jgi:hypothetical protein
MHIVQPSLVVATLAMLLSSSAALQCMPVTNLNKICGAGYCDCDGTCGQARGDLQVQWHVTHVVLADKELLDLWGRQGTAGSRQQDLTAYVTRLVLIVTVYL